MKFQKRRSKWKLCDSEDTWRPPKSRLKKQTLGRSYSFLSSLSNRALENPCQIYLLCVRLFLTIGVSVASCERSFSKLKLIKNYLRSTMSQERLNSLAIISIDNVYVKNINFDDVIDKFGAAKARRMRE